MRTIETIPVPDDFPEPTPLAAVIDAVADFMGARGFKNEWQSIKDARRIEPVQVGKLPTDPQIWHGYYSPFVADVVRPFVTGLSVIAGNNFFRLIEDDGSTCIIDGRPLADSSFNDELERWGAPPDLLGLPDAGRSTEYDFLRWVSDDDISSIGVSPTAKSNAEHPQTTPAVALDEPSERETASGRGKPRWNAVNHAIAATFVCSSLGKGQMRSKDLREEVNNFLTGAFSQKDKKSLFLEHGNRSEREVINVVSDLYERLDKIDDEITRNRQRTS